MKKFLITFSLIIFYSCTSDVKEKSYQGLTERQKILADKCMKLTGVDLNYMRIRVLDNEDAGYARVILETELSVNFSKCDFNIWTDEMLYADKYQNGTFVGSYMEKKHYPCGETVDDPYIKKECPMDNKLLLKNIQKKIKSAFLKS